MPFLHRGRAFLFFKETFIVLIPFLIKGNIINAYQQKWIDILGNANLPGWEITAVGDNISIVMPHVTDLKVIRDNLPEIIAQLSLDIEEPKHPLKLHVKNGYEEFEYVVH